MGRLIQKQFSMLAILSFWRFGPILRVEPCPRYVLFLQKRLRAMYISTSHLPGPVNQPRDSEDRSPRLDKEKREAPQTVHQTKSAVLPEDRNQSRPIQVDRFQGDHPAGLPDTPYHHGPDSNDHSVVQAGIADLIEGLALKIALLERSGGLRKDLVEKLTTARLQFEQMAKRAQSDWASSGGKTPARFTGGLQTAFDDLSASIAFLLESSKSQEIPAGQDAPGPPSGNLLDLGAVFVQKIGNLANRLNSIQPAFPPDSFQTRVASYTKGADAVRPGSPDPLDLSV